MFKGESKSRAARAENPDRLNRLVSGTKVVGDISTDSSLRIDGEIEGNLICKGRFVLGEGGVIYGNINAVDIEINGRVEGNIVAEELLTLHKTAVVKGDVRTSRLVIEDGAQIDGTIQTGKFENSMNEMEFGKRKNKENSLNKKTETHDLVY